MLIKRIELRYIKMELVAPFVTSMGVETHEEHIIIRVDSDSVTGWGECVAAGNPFYSYETVNTAWHILRDYLIPSLLGKRIVSVDEAIGFCARVRGHRMAKAGLEAALWDAFAKERNVPLSEMLGGVRDRIDVGVSIGMQESTQELLRKISDYLEEGYKRIKIKIEPGNDLEQISAIRREYPDIPFQVDANCSYQLGDVDVFKAMDNYNLLLIEQPLGYDDLYDHAKLQQELRTPICLDESVQSLSDTRTALELKSCRSINIKPGRVGGFTESKAIHDFCASKSIPVWHGGMLESGIGRAGNVALASLPNFKLPGDISASDRYYRQDIVDPPFRLLPDGTMVVPTKPGIGVDILMDQLNSVTQHHEDFAAK
jgi:o-succinylbenzoate synthase